MRHPAQFKLIGLGEILWDDFSRAGSGSAADRRPGGAPGNFAYIAGSLGAGAKVISRVGRDALGVELLQTLQQRGLDLEAVEIDPIYKTGLVTVEVGEGGQPRYIIHVDRAWDHLVGEAAARTAVAAADAICFGTLAQRSEGSRTAIHTLLKLTRPDALRIFDVNLRQHYYTQAVIEQSLQLANVVKINEPELATIAGMFSLASADDRGRLLELVNRFNLQTIAYTRGEQGSLLYSQGQWSEHPGIHVTVADTVGAGDAFTAAMALGLLARWPLDEINRRAAEVAAYVCTQPGGMPDLPTDLRKPFLQINR